MDWSTYFELLWGCRKIMTWEPTITYVLLSVRLGKLEGHVYHSESLVCLPKTNIPRY